MKMKEFWQGRRGEGLRIHGTPLDPPLDAVVNKKPTNRTVSQNIVLRGVSGGFGSPDPPLDKEKKSDDKTQKSHTTTPTDETKKEENDREEDLTDDELGLGDPLVEDALTEEDLEREWKEEEERKVRLKEGQDKGWQQKLYFESVN